MSESYTPEYLALAERFRPVFARIAEGVVERENSRTLPLEPLRWLKEAGFGTVRIPVADGGLGATLPQLFLLLTELAEVMLGSSEHFPPPNPPAGLLTRIRIEKVGGIGPWAS